MSGARYWTATTESMVCSSEHVFILLSLGALIERMLGTSTTTLCPMKQLPGDVLHLTVSNISLPVNKTAITARGIVCCLLWVFTLSLQKVKKEVSYGRQTLKEDQLSVEWRKYKWSD